MNVAYLSGNMGGILLSSDMRNKKSFNGKQETFSLLRLLSLHNPQNNYFVYHKCGGYKKYMESGQYGIDFPNKNVRFIANEAKSTFKKKRNPDGSISNEFKTYLDEVIKITESLGGLDFGISFCTFRYQMIPGTARSKRHPEKFLKTLESEMGSAISLYVVEHYRLNYIVYSVDMRFIKRKSFSYTVPPKAVFGFKTSTEKLYLMESFTEENYRNDNYIEYDIPYIYDGADLLTLTSPESIPDNSNINISNKKGLSIYANQHPASEFDRLKCIREFTKGVDLKIYGKFDKENSYYGEDIVGMLDRDKMFEDMKNIKYTFIVPNSTELTLTSSKYWESIHMKVIPFMHHNFGSKEWREYNKIPDFLFIKDHEDLKNKVEFLENNEDEYKKLLENICCLTEDKYNGKFINEKLTKYINKYCL